MLQGISSDLWPLYVSGLSVACVLFFVVKFIRHRRSYSHLPTPPHSLLLGNLKVIGEEMKKYPTDFHPQPMFSDIATQYNFRGLYYMDLYPFAEPLVFILDPSIVPQITSFSRHPHASAYLRGLVGTKSIFSTQGSEWTAQRSWFSPAFSSSHILTLVPGMVEETLVFREKLTVLAIQGKRFSMNDLCLRLAFDVIARSGFDIRVKSQSQESEVYEAFQGAVEWTAGATASWLTKRLSPFMMDWYTRKLDKYLRKIIRGKYAGKAEDGASKSILDLALKGYQKEKGKLGAVGNASDDEEFMSIAVDNAKTFLVGGHDTTASLVTYTYYLLSQHPEILLQVRQEQDDVFGPTLESTIEILQREPSLLNKLPMTLAVFKEVLRLHPAGFTVRQGAPGSSVTFEGRTYPMDNHMICNLNSYMQRSPQHWTDPQAFNPSRFLDPGKNTAAAFLPFEKGPRNCIGQQLALTEAKVIMSLTLRFFDFEPRIDAIGPKIDGWGGRAYQELKLTAKPKDGIPMVVKLRESEGV